MILSQIANFKQFLFDNFSNVGLISLITTVSLVIFTIALRELLSWLTKSDKTRKEMKALRDQVKDLQADIKSLSDKISALNPGSPTSNASSVETVKNEPLTLQSLPPIPTKEEAVIKTHFPLNH